jgi:hypothetical protein
MDAKRSKHEKALEPTNVYIEYPYGGICGDYLHANYFTNRDHT